MTERPKSQARASAEEEWGRIHSAAPAEPQRNPRTPAGWADFLLDLDELASALANAGDRYARTSRERPQERDANRQNLAPLLAELSGRASRMLGQVRPLVERATYTPPEEEEDEEAA